MKGKKIFALVLTGMMLWGCLGASATAAQPQTTDNVVILATNRFNTTVSANTAVQTGNSFSLYPGDVVTIKATYAPFGANMDIGLIAPNGLFYCLSGSNGVFDGAIEVDQRGQYTLAIRNRSSVPITVSGHVNY